MWVSGVCFVLFFFSFGVFISGSDFLTHLCQNSRFGHVVFQPRSFLARAICSKFRGFLLVKFGATTSFSLVSTSVSVLRLAVVDAKRRPWERKQIKNHQRLKKHVVQTVEWIQYRMTQLREVSRAKSPCFYFLST